MSPAQVDPFLIVTVGVLYVGSVAWAYRDAEARGTRGPLVATLVALFWWPASFVVWLWTRPRRAV